MLTCFFVFFAFFQRCCLLYLVLSLGMGHTRLYIDCSVWCKYGFHKFLLNLDRITEYIGMTEQLGYVIRGRVYIISAASRIERRSDFQEIFLYFFPILKSMRFMKPVKCSIHAETSRHGSMLIRRRHQHCKCSSLATSMIVCSRIVHMPDTLSSSLVLDS